MLTGLPDPAILDVLPDAVVIVDGDGNVAHLNRMAERLLQRRAADVVGRPARDEVRLTDEAATDWWTYTRPLAADPRLSPRIPMRDLRLHLADHRSRLVTLTASRVAGDDGRLRFLVLHLRRAEMRQRLDAARSDLVSTVSHEIRSPLTSVKGFTKTLLAKWDRFTDEQKQQMLATVNEDADRVTRLLGELLDVSRIDARRLQLHRQMVDVPAVARRVAERLGAGDHRRPIAYVGSDDVPKLYADPDKVEQIFTNLVENALKYGEGRIEIEGRAREADVQFTVSDEGPGIEEQYLSHIFVKFFRRAGERRAGTGLGLYITKGIVEAHGGRVWAESRVGEGSRFHFTLPLGGLELAGIDMPRRR